MWRRRIKHKITFEERLAEEAQRLKEAAEREGPGDTRTRASLAPHPPSRNGIPYERVAFFARAGWPNHDERLPRVHGRPRRAYK